MKKKFLPIFMSALLVIGCIAPVTAFAKVDISYTIETTSEGLDITVDGQNYSGQLVNTISVDNTEKHTFKFSTILESITEVTINGSVVNPISYDVGPFGVEATYEVDHATDYIIYIVTGPFESNTSNIMWATTEEACKREHMEDPQGNPDAIVEHGKVEIVKVITSNRELTAEEMQETNSDGSPKYPEGFLDLGSDYGYAEIETGADVTVKFIPDYGYQLTKLQINDTVFTAAAEQSTFTFEMGEGELHLSALFTKVADVVKSSTSKVTSGSVKIGSSEIASGSTVLSVKDATLTDEQKATFTTKAGDYKVSNVLDIKLDQVIYKGKADDVWTNPLGYNEDLKTPATITLKLDEGVDGNTVILIHEKEDGTYETIETTYDEATHTISFSTSSFSNYAIASKTVANPKTGDNSMSWLILLIVSLISIAGIVIYRRKQNV